MTEQLSFNSPALRSLIAFRDERDWKQFHTPENLAKSIAIEAAELLECFQWGPEATNRDHVLEELADVLAYAYLLANEIGVDPEEILATKIAKNGEKYPVAKARGNAKKYTEF